VGDEIEAAIESYFRLWVTEGNDPDEVQKALATIPRYIGSTVLDHDPETPEENRCDIVIGFNGTEAELEEVLAALAADDRVDGRRTQGLRNSSVVPRADIPEFEGY
jgi:hypothetical protein